MQNAPLPHYNLADRPAKRQAAPPVIDTALSIRKFLYFTQGLSTLACVIGAVFLFFNQQFIAIGLVAIAWFVASVFLSIPWLISEAVMELRITRWEREAKR